MQGASRWSQRDQRYLDCGLSSIHLAFHRPHFGSFPFYCSVEHFVIHNFAFPINVYLPLKFQDSRKSE